MVISMTSYAIAQPAWTSVTDFDVNEVGNITVLSLQAADNIPHTADDFVNSNAVVGFAWADLDALVLVVATIHPVLGDDSNQNPNAGIHTLLH